MRCISIRDRVMVQYLNGDGGLIQLLFVCHGNICRSPMAEFVFRHLVKEKGLSGEIVSASAATSAEELGNPVHHGTRRKLAQVGISAEGKVAVRLRRADYDAYDYIVGMDRWNMQNMRRLFGEDSEKKLHLLLDYAGRFGEEIADPWYSGDFDLTYKEVLAGCQGLLDYIVREHGL